MNGFNETIPVPEATLSKSAEINQLKRNFKLDEISNKSIDLAYSYGITSTTVDFPHKNGKKSWGVEIEVPLRFEPVKHIYNEIFKKNTNDNNLQATPEEVQKRVSTLEETTWLNCIDLPNNIKKIRILNVAPQESLPKKQRTIDSRLNSNIKNPITNITSPPSENSFINKLLFSLQLSSTNELKRKRAFEDIFYEIFSGNTDKIKQFQDILKNSNAEEILIVLGHSGDDDYAGDEVGEQGWSVNGPSSTWQSPGNRIKITEILEKYNQPEKFGALIFDTCYLGKKNPPVKDIPVYRVQGHSGMGVYGKTKLLLSLPTTNETKGDL